MKTHFGFDVQLKTLQLWRLKAGLEGWGSGGRVGESGRIVRANGEFGGVTGGEECRLPGTDGRGTGVENFHARRGGGGPLGVGRGFGFVGVIEGQVVIVVLMMVFEVTEVEMG